MIHTIGLDTTEKANVRNSVYKYRAYPQSFFKYVLGKETYWSKQIEIIQSVAKFQRTTVRSGHDVGKTYVAADLVLWFLYTYMPSIVITTAPSFRQVEKVLWGEILSHHSKSKIPLGGKALSTEIKIAPKWYAIGFSPDKPDNFQGFHEENVLVVVDEPSGVDEPTFEAIESILSNRNAKLLLIGNPVKNHGYFKNSFQSPLFNKIHISCLDSPNVKSGKIIYPGMVTQEWCEERRKEWGEDSAVFQSRVLGCFPKESEDTLILLEWIERSTVRYDKFAAEMFKGLTTIGLDVARFGSNETVFVVRTGRRVRDIISYRGFDLMFTVSKLQHLSEMYHPDDIIIDDNGLGGGVTDRMIQLGYKNIVPVNSGNEADDKEKFYNKRSELGWRVREAFRTDALDIPNHEKLVSQCSHLFYDQTKKEKLMVASKHILKKKGLLSPDYFDALCLTYARDYSESFISKGTSYLGEFVDNVHIRDLKLPGYGLSRFMVLVAEKDAGSYALWCMADRIGLIYFYRELLIPRGTSDIIAQALRKSEPENEKIDDRFLPELNEDETQYFNFDDQMSDLGFDFTQMKYVPEVASLNLREGLKFDKTRSIQAGNHPCLFFSPSCSYAIRAVKYYLNPENFKNDVLFETIHKAIGLLILAEPAHAGTGSAI